MNTKSESLKSTPAYGQRDLMNDPHNPYSPPSEQPDDETVHRGAPRRKIVLEIFRAVFTIVGIIIGWAFVGAGLLNGTYSGILFGCVIIGVACVVSLGVRFNPASLWNWFD